MKKIGLLIVFCTATILGMSQNTKSIFGIKSGYIEYNITGNTEGTKKVWWDNFGNEMRTETNTVTITKMFGMKNETKEHSIDILKGNKTWHIDLIENSGMVSTMDEYDLTEDMTKEEAEEFTNQMLEAMGGEKTGTEVVLGEICDVYEVMGSKSFLYEGICLKTDADLLGVEIHEVAVIFNKNITVSADKFVAPSDIEYTNLDEMMENMYEE